MKFAGPFLAAALAVAQPVAAADMTEETLRIYAAMAKLEANVVETAANVAMASLMFDDPDAFNETADEAEEDLEAIEFYIAQLRAMNLTADQREAIDRFEALWAPLADEARALLNAAASGVVDRPAVYAWFERVEKVDDIVDDKLEALLEAHGVTFER